MTSLKYTVDKSNNTANFQIDLGEIARLPKPFQISSLVVEKIVEILATEYVKKYKKELMKSIKVMGLHQAVTEAIANIIVGDFMDGLKR